MTDDLQLPPDETPLEGAPTWLRVLQAAVIGLVAGLALNALFSMVHGQSLPQQTPKECKKPAPDKDAVAPAPATRIPALSSVTWVFEGFQARNVDARHPQ